MGEGQADLQFRHVWMPCLFGIILVMASAMLFREKFPPMVIAMAAGIIFAPILALFSKAGVIWEHTLGVAIVCIPVGALWLLGTSFWTVGLTFILWAWVSVKWQNTPNPPFKIGLWHGLGIAFSIVPGAILFGIIVN